MFVKVLTGFSSFSMYLTCSMRLNKVVQCFTGFHWVQEESFCFFQVVQGSVRSDTGFHNVQEDSFRFNEVLPVLQGRHGSPGIAVVRQGSPRLAEVLSGSLAFAWVLRFCKVLLESLRVSQSLSVSRSRYVSAVLHGFRRLSTFLLGSVRFLEI